MPRFLLEFAHSLTKPCQFQEKPLHLNCSLLDFKWTLCLPDIDLWSVFPSQPFKTVAVTVASYFHIVSESDSNYFPLELASMSLQWLISKGYYEGKYRSSFFPLEQENARSLQRSALGMAALVFRWTALRKSSLPSPMPLFLKHTLRFSIKLIL